MVTFPPNAFGLCSKHQIEAEALLDSKKRKVEDKSGSRRSSPPPPPSSSCEIPLGFGWGYHPLPKCLECFLPKTSLCFNKNN